MSESYYETYLKSIAQRFERERDEARAELAHLQHKVEHGCAEFHCILCDAMPPNPKRDRRIPMPRANDFDQYEQDEVDSYHTLKEELADARFSEKEEDDEIQTD